MTVNRTTGKRIDSSGLATIKKKPTLQNSSFSKNDNSEINSQHDLLHIEDYDEKIDAAFINESLKPYLKDLFKDLLMRSNQPANIDKVTFIEYTQLPGIINDRLHFMF